VVRDSFDRASLPGRRPANGWTGVRAVWRIRAGALMLLLAGWLALHALAPDASVRRTWLSLVALMLGYGHLLGASSSSRSLHGSGLERLFAGLCTATALCAFSWAMHGAARLPVLAVLGVVSGWHILENDRAMGHGGRAGRLPPLPRRAQPHGIAVLGTLLLCLTGLVVWAALPQRAPGTVSPRAFALEGLLAALLLYHAIAWILFVLECARHLPPRAARARRRRLLWVHALPVALLGASGHWLQDLHVVLTSPALYLFWSGVHAVQTARARGLESA